MNTMFQSRSRDSSERAEVPEGHIGVAVGWFQSRSRDSSERAIVGRLTVLDRAGVSIP